MVIVSLMVIFHHLTMILQIYTATTTNVGIPKSIKGPPRLIEIEGGGPQVLGPHIN